MDVGSEKVKMDLYVDKEKKQVVKMVMDMSSMAQKMMEDSMKSAGQESSVNVSKFQISITIKELGGSVDIQIPAEAEAAS